MRDEASKVPTHDAMPCGTSSRVEFFLDILSDVLLDTVFFHRVRGDLDGLLLHLFALHHALAGP